MNMITYNAAIQLEFLVSNWGQQAPIDSPEIRLDTA